jgi:hypothetical protein
MFFDLLFPITRLNPLNRSRKKKTAKASVCARVCIMYVRRKERDSIIVEFCSEAKRWKRGMN